MFQKISYFFFVVSLFVFNIGYSQTIDSFDNMPILETLPSGLAGADPIEQRGEEYRKYLAATVKLSLFGKSGSGSIVYYDREKNLAYVASCGHMWSPGVMNYEEGKQRKLSCKIITWYHNEKKLDSPRSYTANVLFYSYVNGTDTSLLTFTPDWEPHYFPIAPKVYPYERSKKVHSTGCDGGSEVAHYEVEIIGIGPEGLTTFRNSPRPGRSGGGLFDDGGWYIGTCWGTQYRNGSGLGYFTTLEAIHSFWSKNGFDFLLNLEPPGILARKIPVIDKKNKIQFSPDYILIPGFGY